MENHVNIGFLRNTGPNPTPPPGKSQSYRAGAVPPSKSNSPLLKDSSL